jgi:hypothetical protein
MSLARDSGTRYNGDVLSRIPAIELVASLVATAIGLGDELALEIDDDCGELPEVFDNLDRTLELLLRVRQRRPPCCVFPTTPR